MKPYIYMNHRINDAGKVFAIFLLLLLAIIQLPHYGIGWDEPLMYELGKLNFSYATNKDPSFLEIDGWDHGVFYEMVTISIENILSLSETKDIYLMRHSITHILYLLAGATLYKLVINIWHKSWLAWIATSMWLLMPRVYAHSFFNSKDIPFLSLVMIVYYLYNKSICTNKWQKYALLGVVAGFMTNIRIMGLMYPMTITAIDLLYAWYNNCDIRKAVICNTVMWGFLFIALFATWPFTWLSPVDHIYNTLKNLSHFPWSNPVLFNGISVPAPDLPWNYPITWIFISTPIPYLALIVTGFAIWIKRWIPSPLVFALQSTNHAQITLFIIGGFAPIALVILLDSVLYDCWRHLYFCYAGMLLVGIYALNDIHQTLKESGRVWLISAWGAHSVWIAGTMVNLFPYNNVYFNEFMEASKQEPEGLRRRWELDYWGTSYLAGLHYILKHDSRSSIRIAGNDASAYFNFLLLSESEKGRILAVEHFQDADYFLSNYRFNPEDYSWNYPEVFYIKRQNSRILSVWKIS